ncbi:MAG: hypothetical protein N839_0015795 [Desulfofustis sp. PB-SRB1]|jgi:hypothetical protein|nr:hypothetical protein [Desulfofustis sp. PB-SRB1]
MWSKDCDPAANNHIHTDSKKRRSCLALLFAAGDVRRWRAKKRGILSMELLSAFLGAVVGALFSFALSEWSAGRTEKKRLFASVTAEVEFNVHIAEKVLKNNNEIDFMASGTERFDWCEIAPLSSDAWHSIVSAGKIVNLEHQLAATLTKAYGAINQVNFAADKIAYGAYSPAEGAAYTDKLREALELLTTAKVALANS